MNAMLCCADVMIIHSIIIHSFPILGVFFSGKATKKHNGQEREQRSELFEGGSPSAADLSGPPRTRTAAEIKAAYGFKSKTNVSG